MNWEKSFTRLLFFIFMKYFYQIPEDKGRPLYGRAVPLDHPVYKLGTLFKDGNKGLILTQMHFNTKYAYWGSLDYWLANDIYTHSSFSQYFEEHASEEPYPIFEVRSAMWAMRMKPLPKGEWERYFT